MIIWKFLVLLLSFSFDKNEDRLFQFHCLSTKLHSILLDLVQVDNHEIECIIWAYVYGIIPITLKNLSLWNICFIQFRGQTHSKWNIDLDGNSISNAFTRHIYRFKLWLVKLTD